MPKRKQSAPGSTLHAYDLELCRYVLDNIVAHVGDKAFVDFLREDLGEDYADFLVAHHASEDRPNVLLSDAELKHLAAGFTGYEHEFDRRWNSYPDLHGRHINCMAEIREMLAPTAAAEWGRMATEFGEQLKSPRCTLSNGIFVVRDWIDELRRLMGAMGATQWLPAPDGVLPTMVPLVNSIVDTTAVDPLVIQKMRETIAEHDRTNSDRPENCRGKHASSKAILELAGVRRDDALRALRFLQKVGEYSGFSQRPHRRHENQ